MIGVAGRLSARVERRVLRSRITVVSTAVEVRGQVTLGHQPKTSRSKRTVPVARSVIRRLEEHLATFVGPEPDALVFTAPRGGPLARSLFSRRVWRPAVIRAGIPSITFHGLRHSFVAILVAAGCNVREVSEWAGPQRRFHADPLRPLREWFGGRGGPSGYAAGRRLEGLTQRTSDGHAETEVSPERVPEPILTARPDRHKHFEEAFRLVRGILRGWA